MGVSIIIANQYSKPYGVEVKQKITTNKTLNKSPEAMNLNMNNHQKNQRFLFVIISVCTIGTIMSILAIVGYIIIKYHIHANPIFVEANLTENPKTIKRDEPLNELSKIKDKKKVQIIRKAPEPSPTSTSSRSYRSASSLATSQGPSTNDETSYSTNSASETSNETPVSKTSRGKQHINSGSNHKVKVIQPQTKRKNKFRRRMSKL
ncbi:unnamed protein product [Gordionus sp. m RMFG-2023]